MPKKNFTQAEIWQYLNNNPLGVKTHMGDLEDLNGNDYIFFDYLTDEVIAYDNKADYVTEVQFTICTKDFAKRKVLVKYLKQMFTGAVRYEHDGEHQYYLARMETSLFIYEP